MPSAPRKSWTSPSPRHRTRSRAAPASVPWRPPPCCCGWPARGKAPAACGLRARARSRARWHRPACGCATAASLDEDLAARDRIGAEHRPREFGAAGADEARDAQDLARLDRKRDIRHRRRMRVEAVLGRADVADPQGRWTRAPCPALDRREDAEVAPDHHPDQMVDAGGLDVDGADHATVAQDRRAIADRHDLVEPVGDVDDADAAGLERAHEVEQPAHLGGAQGRRRLVHDDEARLDRQRAGDLHHLLVGDAEVAHQPSRLDRKAEPVERLARGPERGGPVDEARGPGLAADHDVLGDAERRDQRELLVDGDDALALRLVGLRRRPGARPPARWSPCRAAGRRTGSSAASICRRRSRRAAPGPRPSRGPGRPRSGPPPPGSACRCR